MRASALPAPRARAPTPPARARPPCPTLQTALRLAKLTGKPEYSGWAAVSLHAQASAAAEAAQAPAPLAATGGGRGWGLAPPATPAEAACLKMAEMLLARSLEGVAPPRRDSEAVGLWAHTLVRQGRAGEARAALTAPGGRHSFVLTPELLAAATAAAAEADGAGADAAAGGARPPQLIALPERALEEDVLVTADGRDGRPLFPGPLQPIEAARYAAYLATAEALQTEAAAAAGGGGTAPPPSQLWREAAGAYAALAGSFDAEDWAYQQGYAYCAARAAALDVAAADCGGGGGGEAAAAAAIRAACSPLCASAPTGDARMDAALGPAACYLLHRAAAAAAAGGDAGSGDDAAGAAASPPTPVAAAEGGKGPGRGACLGALQLAASRLELAARAASAAPAASAGLRAAALALLPPLQEQVGSLLLGYVAAFGHKACCFSDVRRFLVMLLPATAAPAVGGSAAAAAAAVSQQQQQLAAQLTAFLDPHARLLAMPFAPRGNAQSASDVAPLQEPLLWSAALPPAQAARVLDAADAWRRSCAPDSALAGELTRLAAEARDAAAAAATLGPPPAAAAASGAAGGPALQPPAEGAAGQQQQQQQHASAGGASKKKGGGKKGGKAADKKPQKGGGRTAGGGAAAAFTLSDSEPEADDACVDAVVMTPPGGGGGGRPGGKGGGGGFDASDPHGLGSVLNPVQQLQYSAPASEALQAIRSRVRRYSTALQLLRFGGRLAPDAGTIDAVVSAWAHTLPLQTLLPAPTAAQSGADGNASGLGLHRDVGEGDELLLLGVHLLWQRGLDALLLRPPAAPAAAPDALAARASFLEALMLLQLGSASSPYNAQFRLAAARTHGWLGVAAGAFKEWRELRVRHSLADALAWVAAPHVARFSWLDVQTKMCEELANFHR